MLSNKKAIWVIFLDELLQSLKTKKALTIMVSYIFLMFIGIKVGSTFEIFAWAISGARQSFSVLLPYYISVGLLPIFAIIISYNSLSEEISQGSVKFLAYRTDRLPIIVGKMLSSFAISTLMVMAAYLIALFYIHSKVGLWFHLAYSISWIYLSIYAFCFICLTTVVSMLAKTPSSSIVWSVLASVLFLVMLNFSYVGYASPFHFSNNALDYILKGVYIDMLLGMLVLLSHAFIYFTASYMLLKRSDLF